MADITFDCPQCGNNLVVDESGAGLSAPCPECSQIITIPSPATAPRPTPPQGDIVFNCQHCKQLIEAPLAMFGQLIDCPACNNPVEVRRSSSLPMPPPRRPTTPPPHIAPKVPRPVPGPHPHHISSIKVISGRTIAALIFGAIVLVAWTRNYFFVQKPVADTIRADSRNYGYKLTARLQYYILPSTLILDLVKVKSVAPVDLFRGLFQSAEVFSDARRRFDKVILARNGKPIFEISGSDFWTLGSEYGSGQNPMYLIRTLPEKLYRPNGRPAYSTWEGGFLGVVSRQMEDATDAAHTWADY